MMSLPGYQMRAILLSLLVFFFIARPISADRDERARPIGADRDERVQLPILAAYKLALKAFKIVGKLKKMLGNQYVAIIQMDPTTFPPSVEPQSTFMAFTPFTEHDTALKLERHYDPERPLPDAFNLVDFYGAPHDGPAGRVITDQSYGWAEGTRGLKMPFGSGKLVRVQNFGRMRTMKRVEVHVDFVFDQHTGAETAVHIFEPVDMVCTDSGPLAGGRVYVYTGGCIFKDITHFDDWAENNTEGYRYFSKQLCGGLAESQWSDCMQYLVCAVDELKWADHPSQFLNAATTAASKLSCPHVGEETRDGMYHEYHTCNGHGPSCTTGSCAFCGTEGLCCRYPGFLLFKKAELEKNGCGTMGCYGRHCCVRAYKSDAE